MVYRALGEFYQLPGHRHDHPCFCNAILNQQIPRKDSTIAGLAAAGRLAVAQCSPGRGRAGESALARGDRGFGGQCGNRCNRRLEWSNLTLMNSGRLFVLIGLFQPQPRDPHAVHRFHAHFRRSQGEHIACFREAAEPVSDPSAHRGDTLLQQGFAN